MPKIKLNLLNLFALQTGKTSITYEGETVSDIVNQFVKEYKDNLDEALLAKNGKKLNKHILILVNGRSIEYLDKFKTRLSKDDQLFISVPLSGG